ncbi:hypothetical protein C1Y11_13370 [Pseudomonas sp. FW305-20]|nr:hypothetical protein C1Y11_13370 [Pseudomonas sp. FW305-20]PMU15571.1 hypothetical protein C1Y10_21780 [Pseudomonas sp. FW305-122]PMU37411.1 hypothetical protein C1Y12_19195 [Pseudomonas sp. FW305-47B]PMX60162.1 hypothetical protein C1Y13_15505 [Pseudomonas sp. FW305-33]PMX63622.1 hypothetical protein C1X12_22470 [Pseudomonas sp. FW305-60]
MICPRWPKPDLWRGGLPPLGCEAAPAYLQTNLAFRFATASRSNGGKPPRHIVHGSVQHLVTSPPTVRLRR